MSTATNKRGPNAWWIATVSGMASYIDAAAIVSFGIVVTIYAEIFTLSALEIGLLSGSLTFAIATGALFGGKLGDRYGRRPVFTATMMVIIAGVAVMIFGSSFPILLTGAILIGLGTGADLPVSLSTISEAGTDTNRGKLVSFSNVLWLAGVIAAIILGIVAGNLGQLGAQILLAHIGIVALIVLACRLTIPESGTWLKASAERKSGILTIRADNARVRDLFRPRYIAPFLGLIFFYALINLANNTGGQFGTYLLVNKAGLDVSTASLISLVNLPIALTGYFFFMRVADKPNRFRFFIFGAVLMISGQLVIALFGFSVITVLIGGVISSVGGAFAGETIMKVWAQEQFPTLVRTTAQGIIFAVARFSAAGLATVTPLIVAVSVGALYWFLTAVTTAGLLIAWIVFRKRDQINEFDTEDEADPDASRGLEADVVTS